MQYINFPKTTCYNTAENSILSTTEREVARVYPFRASKYYLSLIKHPGDAIWKQCMPDIRELGDDNQLSDPLNESGLSPVQGLIHRYPDRAVLLVSDRCPVYCRFCMRKRLVGAEYTSISKETLDVALNYIAATPELSDIVLSGGDPLMLNDKSIHYILTRLRSIPHVAIIRIGSRVPVTMPERITTDLCNIIKQFHPVYINTHFNHPAEITNQSTTACNMLADAGIPLGNQTVLLRDINDSCETMRELMRGLLSIRVKPYYIHQMDLVRGTAHFRTSVKCGQDIIRSLRGHISGLAVPQYVIDLPNGKGKVPILPDYLIKDGDMLHLKTYQGEWVAYQDLKAPQE